MAVFGAKWRGVKSVCMVLFHFAVAFMCIKAERGLKVEKVDATNDYVSGNGYLSRAVSFLWQSDFVGYRHVWPEMKFGWQIIVGSAVGVFGVLHIFCFWLPSKLTSLSTWKLNHDYHTSL